MEFISLRLLIFDTFIHRNTILHGFLAAILKLFGGGMSFESSSSRGAFEPMLLPEDSGFARETIGLVPSVAGGLPNLPRIVEKRVPDDNEPGILLII